MTHSDSSFPTPREDDLGLASITNAAGMAISALPNGCIFAIEHRQAHSRVMINQVLGSPLDGGIGRMLLRIGGNAPCVVPIAGGGAKVRFGAGSDRFVWQGETGGVQHSVSLWLHPERPIWLWYVELALASGAPAEVPCDVVLVQDVGLGERGFLMNCEAYASQYLDHTIAYHPGFGPVILNRQNISQGGRTLWLAHGCLDGGAGFATDALQLFGPAWRDSNSFVFGYGTDLPSERLQHEAGCAAIRSHNLILVPGAATDLTFFGLYEADHPAASSDGDLVSIDAVAEASRMFAPAAITLAEPPRSLLQDAAPLTALPLGTEEVTRIWPDRRHEERAADGELLSFFVPDGMHNRHIVLQAKERKATRRHGTLLRTGETLLPSDSILCTTCWAHGVFGAQTILGNASLHKLFSVSRDPYNITRASGLRILADDGSGWRLLTVPSAFEIGLSDCRWRYHTDAGVISVTAIASAEDSAIQWRVTAEGKPCRFLVFAHLVLGEREYEGQGRVEVDGAARRVTMLFNPGALWGQRYPSAAFHLTVSTPGAVAAIGADELLYADGLRRTGGYVALRTHPTNELAFAVTGSMSSTQDAERLASKYQEGVDSAAMLASAARFWQRATGPATQLPGSDADASAHATLFPWLVHNALIHLSVPHGLEQYSGGAWGTRDVCQGPIELLLALEHDAQVKDILRIIFAQQYAPATLESAGRPELAGDWPQWFMFEPYSFIQGAPSHGDIIVWPLKALCDHIEATGDFAFLDELVAWRRQSDFEKTSHRDSVAAHVDASLATVRSRFIPRTHLVRICEGDWNDALQPADPSMRDHMVSSWTVALLYQQLERYAEVLRRAGRGAQAVEIAALAKHMRADLQQYLIVDGIIAGYAMFDPAGGPPELLLHPRDTRTGVTYSLLPMTRGMLAGIFTPEQMQHHLGLIRQHLLYPDGARLMDRMLPYSGGLEHLFRRAESAAFVGREISLMYVHAHLRYCEAMAVLSERDAFIEGLRVINPIRVTEHVAHATMRQRNAYFTSSDAAFADRYEAGAEWDRLRTGGVGVDGGWRIYSSGAGIFVRLLIAHLAGRQRYFGQTQDSPVA